MSSKNNFFLDTGSESNGGWSEKLTVCKLECFLSLCPVRERIDIEMAQEIQEQLVRQAEQQRQQEEKDEVRAGRLQAIHNIHTLELRWVIGMALI